MTASIYNSIARSSSLILIFIHNHRLTALSTHTASIDRFLLLIARPTYGARQSFTRSPRLLRRTPVDTFAVKDSLHFSAAASSAQVSIVRALSGDIVQVKRATTSNINLSSERRERTSLPSLNSVTLLERQPEACESIPQQVPPSASSSHPLRLQPIRTPAMPNFLRHKQSEEAIEEPSFTLHGFRRMTHSPRDTNFSGTPSALTPSQAPRMRSGMLASNCTSPVIAGAGPVAPSNFTHPRSSSNIRTTEFPHVRTEEEHRAYLTLPKEDQDALASGELNHNLMTYTPEIATEKEVSREALRPRFSIGEAQEQGLNERAQGDSRQTGQRLTQEHHHSSAFVHQTQPVQSASHSRSFTDPAPQLPPTPRVSSTDYGFEQYLSALPAGHILSSAATPLPSAQRRLAIGNEHDATQRGRSAHRPVSRPAAQQPSFQSNTSSRVRSSLSGQWDPASSGPSQPTQTRNANGSGLFAPQPSYPAPESLNSHPLSPVSPVSSRARSPMSEPRQAPSTPPSAASSLVQTPSSRVPRQNSPNASFDRFLTTHESGKGEAYWDNENAKKFELSKEVAARARSESRASNETAASRSSFKHVKDRFAALVRSSTDLKDPRGDEDEDEASPF